MAYRKSFRRSKGKKSFLRGRKKRIKNYRVSRGGIRL